ncbi:hypothetical protein QBC38DRAFT_94273 [Podospora fimiseda]|uniref:Zn(2)-C6 fungal-type domain-containing protein n=1 Tax=Podospora fimiseda TaxID=252190 RepID=A0AAN7H534_9PEZI|nr:hypothetical protein QBC38DRAFT_94273 [Podospora fimiseda]
MSLHTGNEDQDQDGILCMPNAFQPINRPASGYVYVTSDPPTFSTIDYGDYIFDKDVDEIESVYDDDDVDSESSDDFDSGSSDEQQQEEQGESSRAAVMRPGPDNQDGLPKKRARVACRECRRLRTRCVQPNPGKPPCLACTRAGIPTEECEFLKPGEVDTDRDYRHPQGRGYHASRREPGNIRRNVLAAPVPPRIIITGGSPWDLLPPMKEVREAVECFVKHYFQLGFIPKEQFLESLQEKFTPACSPFFLLCLLSISARLTPSLIKRHGTGVQASEVYTKHASSMAMMEVYQDATLDRCQGFFFLSIAEQGSEKQNSSVSPN